MAVNFCPFENLFIRASCQEALTFLFIQLKKEKKISIFEYWPHGILEHASSSFSISIDLSELCVICFRKSLVIEICRIPEIHDELILV